MYILCQQFKINTAYFSGISVKSLPEHQSVTIKAPLFLTLITCVCVLLENKWFTVKVVLSLYLLGNLKILLDFNNFLNSHIVCFLLNYCVMYDVYI